jgi:biopolymer transport protein TolR
MRQVHAGRVREAAAIRGEINVTPLVDVCLVLLIIFMLVAPALRQGIAISLPRTGSAPRLSERPRTLTLAIGEDGSVSVDGARVPQDRLAAVLQASHDQAAEARMVVVNGDRTLPYQTLATVLATVRAAGFDRIGLATEPLAVTAETALTRSSRKY